MTGTRWYHHCFPWEWIDFVSHKCNKNPKKRNATRKYFSRMANRLSRQQAKREIKQELHEEEIYQESLYEEFLDY